MKDSVYLDTTIPSYLFDERESIKIHIEATKKWWNQESKNFDVWISEETFNEIAEGNYPRKDEILKFASSIPILSPERQIIDIAQIYLDNYVMPRVLKGDALHLAYASFYKIDFLLTWNCNHLANANKKRHIRVVNTRLNLATPEIITPLELFSETNDDYQ
ncbi:MAG: type II toxin-antitoxin system VapC family toxin [Synechococcaceae cyanobacterium SM1_2_3]|nr:type II toxin-antitoxin system VapC family toxin [Synechococcaceae cyanobacterium SM1_2_3]